MANYVRNPTWADGAGGATPITAAKLNNIEDGIYAAHFTPAARAYRTAGLAIVTATPTVVALDAELFDTDTIHDNATNNSRLTCKTAGKYQISAYVNWFANATGYRRVVILHNGATVITADLRPGIAAGDTEQAPSMIYDLAVNDYVEIQVTQTSGGNLNIQTNTSLAMARVA